MRQKARRTCRWLEALQVGLILLGAACGDGAGGPASDADLEVTASPLSPGVNRAHFSAAGPAIAFPDDAPAIGGAGSAVVGARSSITLRVPEGATTVRAYGFDCGVLGGSFYAQYLPAYLRGGWTGQLCGWFDQCGPTQVEVQAGRRQAASLTCTTENFFPTLPAFVARQSDYLLNSNYTFDSLDRFAGSDGGNFVVVVINYASSPGASVTVRVDTGRLFSDPGDAEVLGVFATLPDPVSNPTDVWPASEDWVDQATVETDEDFGQAVAYLVVKPGAQTADVPVRVDGGGTTYWLLVRNVGIGSLTAGAEPTVPP